MKDSYGGLFSIWLFMIFFVVYVCFIAVALNFAKTYRVKNQVINILEQYQYDGSGINGDMMNVLDDYLNGVPYTTDDSIAQSNCSGGEVYQGVCVIPMPSGASEPEYFKVKVFFVAEFPFLNINLTIPISGETKTINY